MDAIMRDGTSQENRITPALEEGFIDVDEMRFEDLLAMAVDYARLLTFYNSDNEEEGDWQPFFTSDEAVIMAVILTTDIDRIASGMSRVLSDIRWRPNLLENDEGLRNIPAYALAKRINFLLIHLRTVDGEVGRNLQQKITDLIQEKLTGELDSLARFLRQYHERTEEVFKQNFDEVWFPSHEAEHTAPSVPSAAADEHVLDRFLKANFHAFYNAIAFLKTTATSLLPRSLESQTHDPAIGLYIAFIKLFHKAQGRLNRFTQRHLNFYYHDILKIQPRALSPDHTYLILRPDVEDRRLVVKQDTEFIAGIDDHNRDIIYMAQHDLLVHSAMVRSLCTLHLQRDPLISPEHQLGFFSGAKINRIPVTRGNVPEVGGAFNAHPLFGAPKSDVEQRVFEDAEIGLAIASPMLFLKEGERLINFTFKVEYTRLGEKKNLDDFLEDLTATIRADHNQADNEELRADKLDTFFKVFGGMTTISFTTEDGWYEVADYLPLSDVVDGSYEKNRLVIQVRLPPEVGPIVSYDAEIHGGRYDTDLPLVRFIINPTAYVYPYSLLSTMVIKEIDIEVDVRGIREVLLYNDLGQLDPTGPFNPFGVVPSVGSYLIVGNPEIARKQLRSIEVDIEWGGVPSTPGGFREYYQAYEMPFDSSLFEARVAVLKDGRWLPYDEAEQPRVKLFRDGERNRIKFNRWSIAETVTRRHNPLQTLPADGEFGYNSLSKNGFFKFTLAHPDYAFGHKAYPLQLAHVLTINARLKRPRLFKPIPNPPYTPLINSISLNYRAVSTLNLEHLSSVDEQHLQATLYHIHPFGLERLSPARYRNLELLPQYNTAGNLFIGIAAPSLSGVITLFFHLREDSTSERDSTTKTDANVFQWYYLSSNQWKALDEFHAISDTTNGFLSSGIVTLNIPSDINPDNTIMPERLFWLRLSVDQYPDAPCSVYSVHAQALQVTRQYPEPVHPSSNLQKKLPAGTIKTSRAPLPGITSINQIVNSFGGSLPESPQHLRRRISERLRHKNRATVPWDYERLILEHFPALFKVKCFANMVAEPSNWQRPGHILIAVLPYPKEQLAGHLAPLANSLLLTEIEEFVRQHASPFAKIKARNPAYERVQVRCTVTFRRGTDDGHYQALNRAITDFLSPWNETGYGARFGWRIRRHDIESYIRNLDYVESVTNFSMLHITYDSENHFRLFDTVKEHRSDFGPTFPWSIAIPFRQHFIELTNKATQIQPEITGIGELEVGRTFIIA